MCSTCATTRRLISCAPTDNNNSPQQPVTFTRLIAPDLHPILFCAYKRIKRLQYRAIQVYYESHFDNNNRKHSKLCPFFPIKRSHKSAVQTMRHSYKRIDRRDKSVLLFKKAKEQSKGYSYAVFIYSIFVCPSLVHGLTPSEPSEPTETRPKARKPEKVSLIISPKFASHRTRE